MEFSNIMFHQTATNIKTVNRLLKNKTFNCRK